MKKWIVGITLCVVVGSIVFIGFFYGKTEPSSNSQASYENPVFEPVFADPSAIKAKDGYIYAYGTEDDWGDGEGPRVVPTLRSKDMISWEHIGEAFVEKPSWKEGSVWAPDISYFNEKYYMFYTMSLWGDPNPGIGVAVSDSPAGPFEDKGKLFSSEEIGSYSIDPMLIVEESTPYLFFGSIEAGTFGIELSEDGLTTVGEKFQITGSGYEAPYLIKKDDYYYFFGSAGTCCDGDASTYRVGVGRAESLKGPYLNQQGEDLLYSEGNTILSAPFPAKKGEEVFVGPGHNAVITDDAGTDWLVYHAVDINDPKLENGATRRPLMIDPIIWIDGWPEIQGSVPSIGEQSGPVFYDDEKKE